MMKTTLNIITLYWITPSINEMDDKMYRYILSIMIKNTHQPIHTAGLLTTVHTPANILTFSEVDISA